MMHVGIIGAGQAGGRHAAGFAATGEARLVGVADLAVERASKLAEQHGARAYSDWRYLLEEPLDILVVCLPHNLHVAPAEAAAAQGVHVLMEKPLATTLADAARIVEVCRSGKVKLTVSFVHRFRDELRAMKGWLDAGEIGVPHLARETMASPRGPHHPGWLSSREMAGGGVLMYSAVHGLDRLRWLLGSEVARVTAETRRFAAEAEVEDGVTALLVFENGVSATLSASAPSYRTEPAHWDTEVWGDAGVARVRTRNWAELSNDRRLEHLTAPEVTDTALPHYNFARQAAAFMAACREDAEPAVTGEDGLKALEVALAIYRSAETGETIQLGEGTRL
jgi:predicted dehydrogenase